MHEELWKYGHQEHVFPHDDGNKIFQNQNTPNSFFKQLESHL